MSRILLMVIKFKGGVLFVSNCPVSPTPFFLLCVLSLTVSDVLSGSGFSLTSSSLILDVVYPTSLPLLSTTILHDCRTFTPLTPLLFGPILFLPTIILRLRKLNGNLLFVSYRKKNFNVRPTIYDTTKLSRQQRFGSYRKRSGRKRY